MATRTRVISQNKAVYVTNTGWYESASKNAISGHQLHRVDTLSFDIDLAGSRQDIREFGQLARIGTLTMSEINPSISLGYYLGDGENELALGFTNDTGAQMISGFLTNDALVKERNIYVLTSKEGEDAFNTSVYESQRADHDVIGFGNCTMTSYTANFSVGEIPRADVEFEASNIVFYTGGHSGFKNPALNSDGGRADAGLFSLGVPSTGTMSMLVLRPDDVIVTFNTNNISTTTANGVGKVGGCDLNAVCLQSCSIEVPLSRQNIECLGQERAYAKLLEFPINVTMTMNTLVRNFAAGALEHVLTGTAGDNKTNIKVEVKNDAGTTQHYFELKNAVLDSQNFSIGLDDNETVDLTFSAQIGGVSTTTDGLFWTGAANTNWLAGTSRNTGLYSGVAAAAQPI
jgi:hypothetical protein